MLSIDDEMFDAICSCSDHAVACLPPPHRPLEDPLPADESSREVVLYELAGSLSIKVLRDAVYRVKELVGEPNNSKSQLKPWSELLRRYSFVPARVYQAVVCMGAGPGLSTSALLAEENAESCFVVPNKRQCHLIHVATEHSLAFEAKRSMEILRGMTCMQARP